MKNLIWIILMGASFTSIAQRYVLFNPICMERQKYDVINGYGGESYITYSIQLNDNEKVFLEVGKESDKYENRISRAVITCNSSSINQGMVRKINGGGEQFFIVLKEGQGKFRVSPVVSAAYFKNSDRGIEYVAKDYAFLYNDLLNTPSQNLANPNLGGRVYFVGTSRYECMDAYTFSVSTQQNSNVGSDLTIIPGMGVIEYRTNLSGGMGTRRLAAVNAKTFRSIVQDKCNGGNVEPDLTDRGTPTTEPPVVTNRPPVTTTTPEKRPEPTTNIRPTPTSPDYGMIARHSGTNTSTSIYDNGAEDRIPPTTTNSNVDSDRHTVAKGENLFRIAKKYNITVKQLQDWNNLTNNTIYPGAKLYVSAASPEEGTLVDRGDGNTTPPVTSRPNDNTNNVWDTQENYHVLKRGETIAGVARMHGYTEERFRQLNGLFPNENLPIGYRLKTSDCNCPAQDDTYRSTDDQNDDYYKRDDDYYRDEFVDRSGSIDNGFDDDFRPSVTTPAPYRDSRYRRIDAKETQIPLRRTEDYRRTENYDRNDSYRDNPSSYSNNTARRLDARGATSDDYRRAASPTTYNEGGSALNIRFDRQQQMHLVKENETLYSIARKYKTTVNRLAEANSIDAREVLLPGQSIFIQ